MSQSVVIPYLWPDEDGPRAKNIATVFSHLRDAGFAPDTWVGNSSDPWSPGRDRNRLALGKTDPIIVFNDADSICPIDQMYQAIRLATEAPGLVFAYDLYVRRTKDGRDGETFMGSPSMACVAISRACFEEVGGFDESYVGWGYEDLDFAMRCNALWPNRRVTGPVYHLWHGDRNADDSPADSVPSQVQANLERFHLRGDNLRVVETWQR